MASTSAMRDALLVELARYLRLVAANATRPLSPSPLVDAAWHILLLNPKTYYRACERARWPHAGAVTGVDVLLDHSLAGALDSNAVRRARYVSVQLGGAARSRQCARRALAPRASPPSSPSVYRDLPAGDDAVAV